MLTVWRSSYDYVVSWHKQGNWGKTKGAIKEFKCAACRWIIPFSRQFVSSAISLTPLFPWAWKMAVVKWWLTKCYYEPCGLSHLVPTGAPKDMNYTGVRHPNNTSLPPATTQSGSRDKCFFLESSAARLTCCALGFKTDEASRPARSAAGLTSACSIGHP